MSTPAPTDDVPQNSDTKPINPWSFLAAVGTLLLPVAGVLALSQKPDPLDMSDDHHRAIGIGLILAGAVFAAIWIVILGVRHEIDQALQRMSKDQTPSQAA